MILEHNGTLSCKNDFVQYCFGGDIHYVNGFFYVPGYLAGEESCRQIQKTLEETGIVPFSQMYGAFNYCIQRSNGEILFFPCNSQLHCLYISDHAVSSRYLEHLKYFKEHRFELIFDDEALCEFLTLGKVFFGKTQVQEISILPNDCYVRVQNGQINILKKGIGSISTPISDFSPEQYFADLAHAIGDLPTSLALTGGYDSRMICAQLYDKLPLKLFIRCNKEGESDYQFAQKAADAIECPLLVQYMKKPQLSENWLWEMLEASDVEKALSPDMNSAMLESFHTLKNEGIRLNLSGDGGVLHKDWEWMQDLPFYHRRKTNLNRFYRQRIGYITTPSSSLGPRLKTLHQFQPEHFTKALEPYRKQINTESYDALYYYVSCDGRKGYAVDISNSFIVYAPLLELDFVRYSYHLPRRKRFFYYQLRYLTTEGNPALGHVPTVYGTTASSEPLYLFRDIFFQFLDYGKKACRLIGRKVLNRSVFCGKLLDWSMEPELRRFPVTAEAVAWGISCDLLDSTMTADNMPYFNLLNILTLYMLVKKYNIKLIDN